jgi:hypothetical protein
MASLTAVTDSRTRVRTRRLDTIECPTAAVKGKQRGALGLPTYRFAFLRVPERVAVGEE